MSLSPISSSAALEWTRCLTNNGLPNVKLLLRRIYICIYEWQNNTLFPVLCYTEGKILWYQMTSDLLNMLKQWTKVTSYKLSKVFSGKDVWFDEQVSSTLCCMLANLPFTRVSGTQSFLLTLLMLPSGCCTWDSFPISTGKRLLHVKCFCIFEMCIYIRDIKLQNGHKN